MITTTKTFFLQEELGSNGNFEKLPSQEVKDDLEAYVENDTVASVFKWKYEEDFPHLSQFLLDNGVTKDEQVIFVFNQF